MDFDLSIALERVNFILAQQKNVLLEEDLIGRHIIEILFKNNNEIIFPIREDISEDLLTKFVEIIFVIFNLDKEKRKSFYDYLRNIKKEIYKELSKKDIGDIFGEDDSTEIAEIKLNNSLKKNFPQELNNLLTDSLKIINKINMNNKDKEEVIQKVEKFQSALSDLITSLKEDNKKIKNEIKEKEKNFKKELEKKEDKINKEIKALKEDNEKIKKDNEKIKEDNKKIKEDNEKLKEEMKIIFSKNNNLQEQIVTLKNDSDNKHEQVKELVLNLKKIYENLLCPIDYALIKDPVITKNGITYDKLSLLNWLKKLEDNEESKIDPIAHQEINENELYNNYAIRNIIEIIMTITEKYKLED